MSTNNRPPKPNLQLLLILAVLTASAIGDAAIDGGFYFSPSPSPQPMLHPVLPQSLSPTSLYEPVLNHLGFHTLASAVPSLTDSPSFSAWNGPSTIFAATDSSLSTSSSAAPCFVPRILSEYIVPGLFSLSYLLSLPSPSLVPSLSPSLCLLITNSSATNEFASGNHNNFSPAVKIFVNGIEIIHPDMFDNGIVVVHGIDGFVSHLSPFSCSYNHHELLSALPGSLAPPGSSASVTISINGLPDKPLHSAMPSTPPSPVMQLMLRDAILRLRSSGFGVLALALKVKYAELAALEKVTIFALSDIDIFGGFHNYIGNMRFHVVPNTFLEATDLEDLKVGAALPTLDRGKYLVVTTAGGRGGIEKVRINYVRIKAPEIVKNKKVAVHLLFLSFPHLHPATIRDLVINSQHVGNDLLSSNAAVNDGGAIVNHTERMMTEQDAYSCAASADEDKAHGGNCNIMLSAMEVFHGL